MQAVLIFDRYSVSGASPTSSYKHECMQNMISQSLWESLVPHLPVMLDLACQTVHEGAYILPNATTARGFNEHLHDG